MKITDLRCENMPAYAEKYREFPYCVDNPTPSFSCSVEGSVYDTKIDYYKVLVSSELSLLKSNIGDMWDSGIIHSSDVSNIRYAGAELCDRTTYYFRIYIKIGKYALRSETGVFTVGIVHTSLWGCGFIGAPESVTPLTDEARAARCGKMSPYLRRAFSCASELKSCKAFATAMGVYELFVNGKRAGKYELCPEWTDYKKSIQYQYYDLTDLLVKGDNVIGAILGDGWYSSNITGAGRARYGDTLGFMMNLTLEYTDGSVEYIVTDGSWLCSSGAVVYSDNQNGEYIDATKEPRGWCEPGFDASGWDPVVGVMNPKLFCTRLKASIGPQVREMLALSPISIEKVGDKIIADFGQNMVGHISLKLNCAAGTKIIVRHGEILNDSDAGIRGCDGAKGTLYTVNLRSAKATDTYICRGGGEVFEPHLTFHGFRYVEISGLDYIPAVSDISGHVIYSACEQTGFIKTSDEMINKLAANVLWGQRGNFVGIPTDCPQRDERLGWTGDAQVFCRTACYNMDCRAFFEKFLEDLFEAQKPNGAITDVAPTVQNNDGMYIVVNATAAWGDAAFVIPYTLYRMYNDTSAFEKHLSGMEAYFRCLLGTTTRLLRPKYGYGDWLSIGDDTPLDVLATAYFAYDAFILQTACEALGLKEKAAYYKGMFEKISAEWREAYIEDDDKITGDTQTCYLLALKFKLINPEQYAKTAAHLVRKIEEKDFHLSTGFVGVSYLLPVLCDCGYSDIAYRLLQNDTYPSWGYSIKNGATTIWERWNSYTAENGLGDAGMNSFNHYSLGSVAEWMFSYIGGIRPGKAGFSTFCIKPFFTDRLEFVDCSYKCDHGFITVNWKRVDNGWELKVTIPQNTKAHIKLNPETALVTGRTPNFRGKDGFICGSGEYSFTIVK